MGRLIVVANRGIPDPVNKLGAGGLVVAVNSALQQQGGLFLGYGDATLQSGQSPFEPNVVTVGNVDYACLPKDENYPGHYRDFSNGVVWPTLHGQEILLQSSEGGYAANRMANQQMAHTVMRFAQEDDTLWVHDYHLFHMAHELRQLGYKGKIGFFNHIPWPAAQSIRAITPHKEIVSNMLAYDLIGFQSARDLQNFNTYLEQEMGEVVDDNGNVIGRSCRTGHFPISIDPAEFEQTAIDNMSDPNIQRFREYMGDRLHVIGAERLDLSKGLEQRLEGYRQFLDSSPELAHQMCYTQVTPLSRTEVPAYQALEKRLAHMAGEINGKYSDLIYRPINYMTRGVDRPILAALMRISTIGLVTPLADGMNLVAKEYVSAQNREDPGVLVLSKFAGAAEELHDTVLVNPFDPADIARGIKEGINMPLEQRIELNQHLRGIVEANTVHHWSDKYLSALEECPKRQPTLALPVGHSITRKAIPLAAYR